MLVSMKEILVEARNGKYGVAAPNVINEDTARVCIEAAVEMRAPLILDFAYQFHPDIVSIGKIIRPQPCPSQSTWTMALHLNRPYGPYGQASPPSWWTAAARPMKTISGTRLNL